MRHGICQTPYVWEPWLQPKPVLASWKALVALNITDLRLWFEPARHCADPDPAKWNADLFLEWLQPAHAAGLKVNVNVAGRMPEHADAAYIAAVSFFVASKFGTMIDSYSYGNEPGPQMTAYEDGGADRNYMRDVFVPQQWLPFAMGIRRAVPNAIIGGCDADSVEVQAEFVAAIASLVGGDEMPGVDPLILKEHFVHPYGEVGDMDYATLAGSNGKEGFLDVIRRSNDRLIASGSSVVRRWGITEVDHQQLPSAIARGKKDGPLARLIATDEEIRTLLDFTKMVHEKCPDCTGIFYGQPEYFFERVPVQLSNSGPPERWSTWTYGEKPIVSALGKEFAAAFAPPPETRRRAVHS